MSAVLRLALAYFSAVPLQRGVSIVGAALLALALLLFLFPGTAPAAPVLALPGSVLIILVPFMIGGGLFRLATLRSILHLRPRGRLLMLLAATVAITLVATLATIPVLLAALRGLPRADALFHGTPPGDVFMLGWSITALLWLAGFIASGSRLLSALAGFMPLLLVYLGRTFGSHLPDVPILLAASIAAWMAFGLWYMHAPAIRRPPTGYGDRTAVYTEGALMQFLRSLKRGASGPVSRASATNQYLLGALSLVDYALLGLGWMLLVFVLVLFTSFVLQRGLPAAVAGTIVPGLFMPLFIMIGGSLGFGLTRRARLLWLRMGLDRAALFARAERSGLLAGLLVVGIAAAVFLIFSLASWPDRATVILVFAATQLAFALCLFYVGLSLTRGWNPQDVLLCLGFFVFFFVEVLVLRPWSDSPGTVGPILLAAELLLAPLLRWRARRRWLGLDWRVAKLLPLHGRAI